MLMLALCTSMISADITSRLATTGRLLVRSGIEIGRILDSMLEDGDTVTASLPPQLMLLSKLIRVEGASATMLLAYSENKKANEAALAARSLVLRCNHRGAQFAFAGDKPRYAADAGQPCIRCGLPTTLLGMQQRRGSARIQVPAEAMVRCDLRLGPRVFASRLIDVSLDGICALITDPAIPLSAGTRLESARVRHAEAESFLVDLEVRHATRITLPDGKAASRVGCKLLGSREVLEELIRLFIIDL
ncbi:MAG TPA: flagellar regulator YcgR PilZN domain-containing protein [Burkholderiales bacterium]|nr:flagellar regulator YcgR PilZN domain-containing protein [Burkholderiales bacterium]